jgi:DNA repair exonuclease SbcCD ATPase subunit
MQIEIAGFQSIAEHIKLDVSGFVTITGDSSTGKSAILRAIRALLQNKKGNKFVTTWKDACYVSVTNGEHRVEWLKSKIDTIYKIDGVTHEKAGKSDSSSLVAPIGISSIVAGGKIHWPQIQGQFDIPFIVGEPSPTLTAELLGASQDTADLVKANKLAQKDLNEEKTKATVYNEQLNTVRARIKKVEGFETQIKMHQSLLKDLKSSVETKTTRVNELKGLKIRFDTVLARKTRLEPVKDLILPTPPKPERVQDLLSLRTRLNTLVHLKNKLVINLEMPAGVPTSKAQAVVDLVKLGQRFKKNIGVLKSLEKSKDLVIPQVPDFNSRIQRIRDLATLKQREAAKRKEIADLRTDQQNTERDIAATEVAIKTAEESITTLAVCPTCKRPMEQT